MTEKGRYRKPDSEDARRIRCVRCRTWIATVAGGELVPRVGVPNGLADLRGDVFVRCPKCRAETYVNKETLDVDTAFDGDRILFERW